MVGETLQPTRDLPTLEDLIERLSPESDVSPPPPPHSTMPLSFSQSQAGVDTLLLPFALVNSLRDRARLEGTTVHGALYAALILAGREISDSDIWRKGVIRLGRPISVRKAVNAGDRCLILLVPGKTSSDLNQKSSFWAIARSIREQVLSCMTPETILASEIGLTQLFATNPDVETVAGIVSMSFATDAILTNLGIWPYPTVFADLRVEVVHGPALSMGYDKVEIIGVATSPGGFSLTHVSFEPIPELLQGMEKQLRRACDEH